MAFRAAFRAGGFVAVPVRARVAAVLRAAVLFFAVVRCAVLVLAGAFFATAFFATAFFATAFRAAVFFAAVFVAGTRFDGAVRLAERVASSAARAVRGGRFFGVFAAVAPVARRVAVATFFARAVLLPGAFFAPVALRAAAGLVGVRLLPPRPCAGRLGSATVDRVGPARRELATSAPPRPAALLDAGTGTTPRAPPCSAAPRRRPSTPSGGPTDDRHR
ncbi:hypothetical protein [Plantactinospora veratri]